MKRILFVSNGHGEEAIAARLAREVQSLAALECDHLALVGDFGHPSSMCDVGPRRKLPSGGLIAMGNLPKIAGDLRAGLLAHTWRQRRFLASVRGDYSQVVAVGDVFGLLMALQAGSPVVYVGTAKSVYVAPYGRLEERVLKRARAVFVRDEATAKRLRDHGVSALAPGNPIVDLYASDLPAPKRFARQIALFPGSRAGAYDDGAFLCEVMAVSCALRRDLGGVLSIAPGLTAERFAADAVANGWRVLASEEPQVPFLLEREGRALVAAWTGPVGSLLPGSDLVLGQAGTANEAAAAAGVPVVALERAGEKKSAWYRMRQRRLLGDALRVVSGEPQGIGSSLAALLDDSEQLAQMTAAGRERMGPPGGVHAIARAIVQPADSI
ncbi:MAG: lipid-A-disaccharide synthase-related protein [Candidatus Eremiobacteraeota bacterium]|nr:lipid-A-disaccharide synthase-related protein [Candidatus Eremiobacteraeota bacterium]